MSNVDWAEIVYIMQTMLSKLILAMNGMDYWFPENQENYCPEKNICSNGPNLL